MRAHLMIIVAVLAVPAASADVAPSPPPSTSPPPALTLVAAAEIELVDVEGAGGFSEREPSIINPRVRAPYVELDKATLESYLQLEPRLRATMELRASRTGARIDRLFVDGSVVASPCWTVDVQAGRQKPMQRPGERRTETFSPLGSLFWRGREWHLGASLRRHLGAAARVEAIGSVAMQRDLGDEPMGEDPALPSLAFGNGEVREGSAAELGGLLGVSLHGAHAAAFGFRGALLDNAGPERLEQTFSSDYTRLGDASDLTSHWYGARAGYDGHGVYLFGEAIRQQVGLARRVGFEAAASYTFTPTVGGRTVEVEPFVRYGALYLTNLPERFLIPESWDRRQVVGALLLRPSPAIELKLEYLVLGERTGDDDERADTPTRRVRDNQLLVHLRLEKALL